MPTLTIIRGLPGSGKSTLARYLVEKEPNTIHVEADMFHHVNGKYSFDANWIEESHRWCQLQAIKELRNGKNVVVANTFTQLWELDAYFDFVYRFPGIEVKVLKCIGDWGSVHGIPEAVEAAMASRWQDYPGEEPIYTMEVEE